MQILASSYEFGIIIEVTWCVYALSAPLSVEAYPLAQRIDAGFPARIECRIKSGFPVRMVQWLHNGRLIQVGLLMQSSLPYLSTVTN